MGKHSSRNIGRLSLISGGMIAIDRKIYGLPSSLLTLPLRWSGVGGLRRLPRATITDLKDRSGGTGGKTLGTHFFACGRKRGRRTKKKKI